VIVCEWQVKLDERGSNSGLIDVSGGVGDGIEWNLPHATGDDRIMPTQL
jgi:hypothetical protein